MKFFERQNVFLKWALILIFILMAGIVADGLLVLKGSEKVVAFLLPENNKGGITKQQKDSAINYFKFLPFVFRQSVEYYFKHDSALSSFDYIDVVFLPPINKPWVLPLIFKCLNSSDPNERLGAVDAINQYSADNTIISKLIDRWKVEDGTYIQLNIAEALCRFNDGRVIQVFTEDFEGSDDIRKRNICLVSLYKMTLEKKLKLKIEKIIEAENPEEVRFLNSIAWAMLREKAKPFLIESLKSKDDKIHKSAEKYLTLIKKK